MYAHAHREKTESRSSGSYLAKQVPAQVDVHVDAVIFGPTDELHQVAEGLGESKREQETESAEDEHGVPVVEGDRVFVATRREVVHILGGGKRCLRQ